MPQETNDRLKKRQEWWKKHKPQKDDEPDEPDSDKQQVKKIVTKEGKPVTTSKKRVSSPEKTQKTPQKKQKGTKEKESDSDKTLETKQGSSAQTSEVKKTKQQPQKKKKKYYVLFIGNLPFDATEDDIREHFMRCGVIEDVRILTNKETGKPRGCAYLQFESMSGHKNALMLHKSSLNGREINVEFTAPGRKNASRSMKLQQKNKKLARYKLSRDCILPRPDGQTQNRPQKFRKNTS